MKCKSDFLIWYFILIPLIWFSKICCSCKIVFHKLHCISSKLLEETNCGICNSYITLYMYFLLSLWKLHKKIGFFRFSRRKTNMLNSFFPNLKSISFAFFSLGHRLKRRNSLLNWSRKTAKELQGRWNTYWDSLHPPYKYPLADGFDRV